MRKIYFAGTRGQRMRKSHLVENHSHEMGKMLPSEHHRAQTLLNEIRRRTDNEMANAYNELLASRGRVRTTEPGKDSPRGMQLMASRDISRDERANGDRVYKRIGR